LKAVGIKRAIRDFAQVANDYLRSHYDSHHNNLNRFFTFAYGNEVIRQIIDPLMKMPINLNSIFETSNGFWISHVNLPLDQNERIAAVLQLMEKESKREISFEDISLKMNSGEKNLPRLLAIFNQDIVAPAIRDLFTKLDDFIEDEIEHKEEVPPNVLNIFYGNITAQQGGNVAIGHSITQTANYRSMSEKLMQEVVKDDSIPNEQHERIKVLAENVEEELRSPEPNKSKLKDLVGQFYNVGKNGLLKLTKSVIEDPRWASAISDYFLDS